MRNSKEIESTFVQFKKTVHETLGSSISYRNNKTYEGRFVIQHGFIVEKDSGEQMTLTIGPHEHTGHVLCGTIRVD